MIELVLRMMAGSLLRLCRNLQQILVWFGYQFDADPVRVEIPAVLFIDRIVPVVPSVERYLASA